VIHETGFDDTFYYLVNERQIRDSSTTCTNFAWGIAMSVCLVAYLRNARDAISWERHSISCARDKKFFCMSFRELRSSGLGDRVPLLSNIGIGGS